MIESNLKHTTFTFPVGEMQVNVEQTYDFKRVNVTFTFTKNEDIIELLLFCDATKRAGFELGSLRMNYVPFSRQDRVNADGESLSLHVFCTLINALNFQRVHIQDPHSEVTPALLNNCVVDAQWDLIAPLIAADIEGPYFLVAPDAGALKKSHKLAQTLAMMNNEPEGFIESSKLRNTKTGEILATVVHMDDLNGFEKFDDYTYVIADDICDGGRTFIELAKALRAKGAKRIHLYVTHGFFTKGKGVFKGIIDEIHSINDHSERFI